MPDSNLQKFIILKRHTVTITPLHNKEFWHLRINGKFFLALSLDRVMDLISILERKRENDFSITRVEVRPQGFFLLNKFYINDEDGKLLSQEMKEYFVEQMLFD